MNDERAGTGIGTSANSESPLRRNLWSPVLAPVSVGELIDKIVILEIKAARISEPAKLAEVSKELNLLNQIEYGASESRQQIKALKDELRQINEQLWGIEDRIRDCERRREFGPDFVELARAVYMTNDRRAALKHRINEVSCSVIREVKAHPSY
jgi:predicted  nucleic acid-binding Zn-ribbon protein